MDIKSVAERSANMARIKSKNTSIEKKIRKRLFKLGFRYRKNVKGLPGTPDIVLQKYRTVIYIHGCFWHRHANCKQTRMPKSNIEFWRSKFETNVARDERNKRELQKLGWRVITLWECEINHEFENVMDDLVEELIFKN